MSSALLWTVRWRQKESQMAKPRQKKAPVTKMTRPKSPGKSEKQDNQKKAAGKAPPRRASLKKVRATAKIADNRSYVTTATSARRPDDLFALQSDPIAAVLGVPIHVLHASPRVVMPKKRVPPPEFPSGPHEPTSPAPALELDRAPQLGRGVTATRARARPQRAPPGHPRSHRCAVFMKLSSLTLSQGLPRRPRADETMFDQSSLPAGRAA